MITTPLAKHAELAYELFRWYRLREDGDTYADAELSATAVINALVAATPFDLSWTVPSHPIIAWISDTFQVHWKRAAQAYSEFAAPPKALRFVSGEAIKFVDGDYIETVDP